MSDLKEFIGKYRQGLMSADALVLGLSNWTYTTSFERWEEGAPIIEGSFDEVIRACSDGGIPDHLYVKIILKMSGANNDS